jgi:hypothetical protein
MSKQLSEKLRNHSGKYATFYPGEGWGLSYGTSCTYLMSDAGAIEAFLLKSSPGEDREQVVKFLYHHIASAQRPDGVMQEAGITGVSSQPYVASYIEEMDESDRLFIEKAIAPMASQPQGLIP